MTAEALLAFGFRQARLSSAPSEWGLVSGGEDSAFGGALSGEESGVSGGTGDWRKPFGSRVTPYSQPADWAAAAVTASSKLEKGSCSAAGITAVSTAATPKAFRIAEMTRLGWVSKEVIDCRHRGRGQDPLRATGLDRCPSRCTFSNKRLTVEQDIKDNVRIDEYFLHRYFADGYCR